MKIIIKEDDNLPIGEYELTNHQKLECAKGNLSLGASGRILLFEHDRIAGRLVKDGVMLLPQILWRIEQERMNKPIEQFTDEELLAVIRRAENTTVQGSLFQRAKNEWDIRCQQKILEATKTKQHTGVFIAARTIKNSGSITGSRVDVITENYSDDGTVSSHNIPEKPKQGFIERITNNQTIAIGAGGILLLIIGSIFSQFGLSEPIKKGSNIQQNSYGSGDNIAGDKIENSIEPRPQVYASIWRPSYKSDDGLYHTEFYVGVIFSGDQKIEITPAINITCSSQKYEGAQTAILAGVVSGTYYYSFDCTSMLPIEDVNNLFDIKKDN